MTNQYYNAAADAVPGTTVRSAQFNDNNDSLEQGFDLLPDPQTLFTTSQNFTDATTDPLNANLYLATVADTTITTLSDGAAITIRSPSANTGPAQFNLNSLGAKQIRTPFGEPIVAGDIPEGAVLQLRYNLTEDYWQLESALTAVVRAEEAARIAQEAAESITEIEPRVTQNEAEIASLNARVGQTSIRVDRILSPLSWLFQKNQLIDTMAGQLAFTRNSTATIDNIYGTTTSFRTDEPRQNSLGWVVEGARQNLFTNPESPAAQDVVLSAGTYTISVRGTGRAETTYGNATEETPLTFTSTGETLTVSIFGSLTRWQIEEGSFASSFVNGTRAQEIIDVSTFGNLPRLTQPWTITERVSNLVNSFCIIDVPNFLLQVNSSGVVTLNGTAITTAQDFTTEKVVSLVYDGTNVTPYIDATAQTAVAMTFSDTTTGNIRFGSRADNSESMFGTLSDFRTYDFGFTVDEIGYLYLQRA